MYLKLALLLLFSLSCFGFEMSVKNKTHYYKVEMSSKKILITSLRMELTLEKKKCNSRMFASFHKTITRVAGTIISAKKPTSPLEVIINKKTFLISDRGRKAATLLSIPGEFHRIKIEENLACQAK